jgi:glutamate synthase (NADPH/NADH) small chain
MAAAQQLNHCGHSVTVFERANYIGGLLRLGIPDFKLEKHVVQRRVDQMKAEGVAFRTGVYVGTDDYPADKLLNDFDAIVLTIGSTIPRDLPVPGRELDGVHFAMDFLTQQNKINSGESVKPDERISAEGKRVLVLGGGDTGSDCLGTSHRQGAEVVYQYELLSEPPKERRFDNPWPRWPLILRTSSSQEEGGIRDYDILTTHFSGNNGHVEKVHAVRVEWGAADESGRPRMNKVEGSEFEMDIDLVLLAMGFLHPEPTGLVAELGLELDLRGNIKTDDRRMTSVPNVFAAGDCRRGQSLVVWALAEGRDLAYHVDMQLMGETKLRPVLNAV